MASLVLKTLSIFLGMFFIFVGLTKITPRINAELHRELVRTIPPLSKLLNTSKMYARGFSMLRQSRRWPFSNVLHTLQDISVGQTVGRVSINGCSAFFKTVAFKGAGNFVILHHNVRNLLKNGEQFMDLVCNLNIQISCVLVTETWALFMASLLSCSPLPSKMTAVRAYSPG